jgi:hypothetical protein
MQEFTKTVFTKYYITVNKIATNLEYYYDFVVFRVNTYKKNNVKYQVKYNNKKF